MPIYEYMCEKCSHEFQREQRITADPIKTCPECKARRVKKLISQTSFVLKGGGWYNDLYSSAKKDDSGDAKPETKKSDDKDSKKEGGTKDSKTSKTESGGKKPKKGKKSSKTAA